MLSCMEPAQPLERSAEPQRGGTVVPPAAPTGRPKVWVERPETGAPPLCGFASIGHPEALCAGEFEGAAPPRRGGAAGAAPMLDTKGTSDETVPPRAPLFRERRLTEAQFRNQAANELDQIGGAMPAGKLRRRFKRQANRLRECGQLISVRTCRDCGSNAPDTARLLTTCQLRLCPTCARYMANAARSKGKELLRQMTRTSGCRFFALHLSSRFDPSNPAEFTIDAIASRCQAVKQAAKYVWNRVLKHPGAGFITALEVAPGGMVHIHAIYYGRYQDVNVIRMAWLEKLSDSPQLRIDAVSKPEDAVPEVFKYMMKLAAPRNDERAGQWMDPVLAARVEVALSGKRRSESYGAFRGVKLEEEPPEEQPTELRCEACGNTERFGQCYVPRHVWQREHANAPLRLSRTGVVQRIEDARRRRQHGDEHQQTRTTDSSEPGATGEAHLQRGGARRDPGREPQNDPRPDHCRSDSRHSLGPRDPHPTFGDPQAARGVIPSIPKQARDVPPTE
jgi:hypothetical protein